MIPKYPDSVEWFLIDRHFSNQWSDYNYDHGTCKEQYLVSNGLVPRLPGSCNVSAMHTGRHNTSNTRLNTCTEVHLHTRTHAITQTHTHQKPQIINDFLNDNAYATHHKILCLFVCVCVDVYVCVCVCVRMYRGVFGDTHTNHLR